MPVFTLACSEPASPIGFSPISSATVSGKSPNSVYTDVPAPTDWSPNFAQLVPFAFDTREVALDKACLMLDHGAVVWRVDGPDGFSMSRVEVTREYRRRRFN